MEAASQCLDSAPGVLAAPSSLVITTTAVAATLSALYLSRWFLWPALPPAIPNPLKTRIPKLSKEELEKLDYHPDSLPGARDVKTPVRGLEHRGHGKATS